MNRGVIALGMLACLAHAAHEEGAAEGNVERESRCEVIGEDLAKAWFEYFRASPEIPFAYPEDGCFGRAALMDRDLEGRGVVSRNVFAVSDPSIAGQMGARSEWTDEAIEWWYHVAPTVKVEDARGKVEEKVLDPAVAKGPVSVEEWLRIINLKKKCQRWDTDPADLDAKQRRKFAKAMESRWPVCLVYFKHASITEPGDWDKSSKTPDWDTLDNDLAPYVRVARERHAVREKSPPPVPSTPFVPADCGRKKK